MRPLRAALAVAASLIGAVLAMGVLATPAHATSIETPFAADSGDACRYGQTRGILRWNLSTSPLPIRTVDVKGSLLDRPLPADPGSFCPDDRRFSSVTFTAYLGTTVVDQESRRVDNGVIDFGFTLGLDSTTTRGIDRVVVQVCRHTDLRPFDYCGRPQEYRAPPVG